MADAIENAAVVLIAMSQRYKESPNCRTGASQTQTRILSTQIPERESINGSLGKCILASAVGHTLSMVSMRSCTCAVFHDFVIASIFCYYRPKLHLVYLLTPVRR